jgi:hypothetical protein
VHLSAPVAETAWRAAWKLHDWAVTDHPNVTESMVELKVLREQRRSRQGLLRGRL